MSTTYNRVHYDRDIMRPCIYGLAVGDAVGVPYEFCERGTFKCTGMADGGAHGQPAGTWPDDTPTALCVCPSIKRPAYTDAADIADRSRRCVLRLRGHPAEVDRPAARQGRNRPTYLGRIDDD